MFRVVRGPALRFLSFLHGLPLPLGILLYILSLLLGGPLSLAAILSNASIFRLRHRRDCPGNRRGEQNHEGRKSFHNSPKGRFCINLTLSRSYTETILSPSWEGRVVFR
jgi:hypothetical protein